jgi:hypothetical protein
MVQIIRQDAKTIAISGLGDFHCELLRQIPVSAAVDEDDLAYDRIYPSPSNNADEESDEDWKLHVEPDLRQLFQSAMEIVQGDLENFPEDESADTHTLRLPVSHLRAWLNSLNQARLALATRHAIGEGDLEAMLTEGGARSLAILQIDFYGWIQECFVRELAAL